MHLRLTFYILEYLLLIQLKSIQYFQIKKLSENDITVFTILTTLQWQLLVSSYMYCNNIINVLTLTLIIIIKIHDQQLANISKSRLSIFTH